MTLGQRLGGYLEQRELNQTAVAADWLERWKGRGEKGPPWSESLIQAQLGRLLKDQVQGIRFFFQDLVRGKLLLQALQVPEAAWTELFTLAGSALHKEGASAKVLIDVTGFGPVGVTHAGHLFAELKRLLVLEGPYPIDLILLEEQSEHLPRGLDPLLSRERDRLRTVQVKTPEQGWQVTCERAEDLGLVVSSRRYPVFERWLAADFDGTTLRLEPVRGMEWLRNKGALPSLPPVTHDLSALVPAGQEKSAGLKTYSACEQHRWMHILRSEEESMRSNVDAPTRQGLARFFGITATSTPKERLDAEVRALGQELPGPVRIQSASAEDLRSHQQRARRRKLEPTALRVEDIVYLLNVPDAARLARSRPWVSVHTLEPEPTALGLLLAEVDRWSEFDFLRDPFLEHLIQRLDPEEKKRPALLHARAGLLLNEAVRPRTPEPEARWHPLLEELLSQDPPPARLRVHLHGKLRDEHGDAHTPFLVTRAQVEGRAQLPVTPLRHVPPLGDALVDRGDPLLLCAGGEASRARFDPSADTPLRIARSVAQARDPDFWLNSYELSTATPPGPADPAHYLPALKPWRTAPLHIAPAYWAQADRELALVWLALRMALRQPRAIRLPDGAVLLQLGGAFFAELRISRLAQAVKSPRVQACLLLEADSRELARHLPPDGYRMTDKAFRISDLVTTHSVTGGYDVGARLPRRIHLLGEHVCADLRFRGSALFSEAPPASALPAASARGEEERTRATADGDDDD